MNRSIARLSLGAAAARLLSSENERNPALYRNHCPACLWSQHVDVRPGDRASACRGLMEPTAVEHRAGKGMVIVHRCQRCGLSRANRVAVDPVQGDDIDSMVSLMQRPPARADAVRTGGRAGGAGRARRARQQ